MHANTLYKPTDAHQHLFDSWVAKNGKPRVFAMGDTNNVERMQFYLEKHGFRLHQYANRVTITTPAGKRMKRTWPQLHTLVDILRMKEGLEPMNVRNRGKRR